MNFYTVRLKRHPHLFVGKSNPSYALRPDDKIKDVLDNPRKYNYGKSPTVDDILQIDAFWFVNEKKAKVWTDIKDIKRLFSYANNQYNDEVKSTFSEYEILCNNEVITVDFL